MPRLIPRRQTLRKGKYRDNARHQRQHEHRWLIRQLVAASGGRCTYCGEQVNLVHGHPKQATVDHVIPLSRGGLTVLGNVALACSDCNNAKGDDVAYDAGPDLEEDMCDVI